MRPQPIADEIGWILACGRAGGAESEGSTSATSRNRLTEGGLKFGKLRLESAKHRYTIHQRSKFTVNLQLFAELVYRTRVPIGALVFFVFLPGIRRIGGDGFMHGNEI